LLRFELHSLLLTSFILHYCVSFHDIVGLLYTTGILACHSCHWRVWPVSFKSDVDCRKRFSISPCYVNTKQHVQSWSMYKTKLEFCVYRMKYGSFFPVMRVVKETMRENWRMLRVNYPLSDELIIWKDLSYEKTISLLTKYYPNQWLIKFQNIFWVRIKLVCFSLSVVHIVHQL